jgi:hypothetical protein
VVCPGANLLVLQQAAFLVLHILVEVQDEPQFQTGMREEEDKWRPLIAAEGFSSPPQLHPYPPALSHTQTWSCLPQVKPDGKSFRRTVVSSHRRFVLLLCPPAPTPGHIYEAY